MSPILLHFLATLATNADLMGRYLKDPETTMALFGLSAEDTALVLRRDTSHLEAVVRQASVQYVYVPYPVYGYPQAYYPPPVPMAPGMMGGAPPQPAAAFVMPGPATHFFTRQAEAPASHLQGMVAPTPAAGQAVARAEFSSLGPRPIPGPATHIVR